MDAIVLTRMALAILFWPMVSVVAVGGGVAIGIVLLASYPVQTVVGTAIIAGLGMLAWRWISGRRRPRA